MARELQTDRLRPYVESGAAARFASSFFNRDRDEQMRVVQHVRKVQAEKLTIDEQATEALRSIMAAPDECVTR